MKRYWVCVLTTPFIVVMLFLMILMAQSVDPEGSVTGSGVKILVGLAGSVVILLNGWVLGIVCALLRCRRFPSILAVYLGTAVIFSLCLQGNGNSAKDFQLPAFYQLASAANAVLLWWFAVVRNPAIDRRITANQRPQARGARGFLRRIQLSWIVLAGVSVPILAGALKSLPDAAFFADARPLYANASGLAVMIQPAVEYRRRWRLVVLSDPPPDEEVVGDTCLGRVSLRPGTGAPSRPLLFPDWSGNDSQYGSFGISRNPRNDLDRALDTTRVFADNPDFIFLWDGIIVGGKSWLLFSFDRGATFQRAESDTGEPPAYVIQSGSRVLLFPSGNLMGDRLRLRPATDFALIERVPGPELKFVESPGSPGVLWDRLKVARRSTVKAPAPDDEAEQVIESGQTMTLSGLQEHVEHIDIPDFSRWSSTISCTALRFKDVRRNGAKPA